MSIKRLNYIKYTLGLPIMILATILNVIHALFAIALTEDYELPSILKDLRKIWKPITGAEK